MILDTRSVYKPFEYDQFFEYFKLQQQSHWLPTEVPMADDILDFNSKLTPGEKNLIIQVLRFFTQGDVEVMNNYNTNLIKYFPKPEITMMLTSFAAMETIHVWAYSQLNDTLGLPEEEYSAFQEYDSMKDKYNFLHIHDFEELSVYKLLKNLAVFGGFMEGVSLFGSFAILMNFPRRGLLKNVGQIVTWSVRDESLHSEGVCELFRVLAKETGALEKEIGLVADIMASCKAMVELEDTFIDTCFELGDVEGLKASQVKQYVRYIANMRLKQLGFDPIFDVKVNPLPWMTTMMSGKEHANFFEARATEYSKGTIINDW